MTLRATADIYAAPGVLAYRKGDVIEKDAAERLGATDKVATEQTKAVAEAVKDRVKAV